MKVLFVSSGNVGSFGVVPFIREQGASLQSAGAEVEYFPIHQKGFRGYLSAIWALRRHLKKNYYDVVHAHFVLSAWVAVLANIGRYPLIVSLMGSDAYGEYVGANKVQVKSRYLTFLTLLIQPFVDAIISKSANIENWVYLKKKSFIIPNGIDTRKFKADITDRKNELSLNPRRKNILFLGSRRSVRKNIRLVEEALQYLDNSDVELINPYPVPHEQIPKYLNAVDVLAVCSFMEGSANVIKEAMSCNCPIVATDVGDARWVFGNTDGYFLASFEPRDYAEQLRKAIDFSTNIGRTKGEERIRQLQLDAGSVARRVLNVYQTVLK